MKHALNILISSAGRRVALIHAFHEALDDLGIAGQIFAADCSRTAPAFHAADESWVVPPSTAAGFTDAILDLVHKYHIGLIVPTIDTELPAYAQARHAMAREGARVAVSSAEATEICCDKWRTYQWLAEHGFPTVRTARTSDLAPAAEWPLPAITKPARGSASIGVMRLSTPQHLAALPRSPDRIVQEIAEGAEYTINVFARGDGRCAAAVPHHRMEVRNGEVSKGVTRKHRPLMELGRQITEALPGAYGALNIQGFLAADDTFRLIEINGRFGGGYPLAHRAGARFTHWLVADALGLAPQPWFEDWSGELAMLRFDEAVYLPAGLLHV